MMRVGMRSLGEGWGRDIYYSSWEWFCGHSASSWLALHACMVLVFPFFVIFLLTGLGKQFMMDG